MNPLIKLKTIAQPFLIAVSFAYFGLSPTAKALLPPPPPDGGYPNGNTAEGAGALFNLTTGGNNTAIGTVALGNNTSGINNTAIGSFALLDNTTGGNNTATGLGALSRNIIGESNTASGVQALYSNTTGVRNTANGFNALLFNTTGSNNTANGSFALISNTTGTQNTATGQGALTYTTANNNTAVGFHAAFQNRTGVNNTAIGLNALANNTIGSSNIALGKNAGVFLTTGSNNIDIGNVGVGGESNTIRIGNVQTTGTIIKGISGVALAGATVVVNAAGQLGVAASSAHFKHEIRAMDKESEAILALNPVSFCYDQDIDEQGLTQFGLVAEEVEKVNPDLVVRDTEGKPYSVRYDQVNAMLLNEFLKEHRKNEEQQKQINVLTAQLKEQAAQIQKVSADLEASKPAPQVVNNP